MNLNQLKYFQAVCTYHTVSAAAEYLHISQPSLSNAIKDLENEFGVILFYRHHHGMSLTSEGETLLKMSRTLLGEAEHIEKIMNDMGNERKKLRLGVPPMIGSLLTPRIYNEFFSKNPDIKPDIIENGREELLEKLNDETLDMIFIPHNRPIDSKLSYTKVSTLEIVCCTEKSNPLASKKSITAADLKDIPIVLFKNSFFQTEEIKKWFVLNKIKPNILLQTNQLSTIEAIIENNVAVGFLFKELLDNNSKLVSVPVKDRMKINVSLVWKKDAYFSAAMKKFRNYFLN